MSKKLISFLTVAIACLGSAQEVFRAVGGETQLIFNMQTLNAMGIRIKASVPLGQAMEVYCWEISENSDFRFQVAKGELDAYLGGSLIHEGGFMLECSTAKGNFRTLRISYLEARENPFAVQSAQDKNSSASMEIIAFGAAFVKDEAELYFAYGDLVLTDEGARALGHPEWKGLVIAMQVTEVHAVKEGGSDEGQGDPPNFSAGPDVRLTDLTGLRQQGRIGDQFSMTQQTSVINDGTTDTPWYWAIAPAPGWAPIVGQHPYIAFALYRYKDGKFEQVGFSDVKHGFFATNQGCTIGGQQYLKPGCRDTYSTSNNGDPYYYGPRAEINPFTGTWDPCGSHFDGATVDCTRESHSHDALTHLLRSRDAELEVSGARFFVESAYIVKSDSNPLNNWGFREVTPSKAGTVWSFANVGAMQQGYATSLFGDRHDTLNTGEGQGVLTVTTTHLTGATYHYEYSMMNVNFDRRFSTFGVPLPVGSTPTNVAFHDSDFDGANDWTWAVENGWLVWRANDPNGNDAMSWGQLHNFRFDIDATPVESAAQLDAFKPGVTHYTVATKGPASKSIHGHVDLGAYVASPAGVPIVITLLSGGSPVETINGTLDSSGNYSVIPNAVGHYDVRLKASHWLSVRQNNVAVGGTLAVDWTLALNGDADNNNVIDLFDLNIMLTLFGQPGPDGDVDGNGQVDIGDLNIVLINFGSAGI